VYHFPPHTDQPDTAWLYRVSDAPAYQKGRGISYCLVYGVKGGPAARGPLPKDLPHVMQWVMNGFSLNGKILPHYRNWAAPEADSSTDEGEEEPIAADIDFTTAATVATSFESLSPTKSRV
jgi:hypothetical protein